MGIKIGDVDVANEVVALHYQLLRTQLILERIINATPALVAVITAEEIRQIDDRAIEQLKRKFPNMGISKTEAANPP